MKKQGRNSHIIVAIHVTNRVKQAGRIQTILSKYGGYIKTRIGLHEALGKVAGPNGVILLELIGAQRCVGRILADLNSITGVEAKCVVFEH